MNITKENKEGLNAVIKVNIEEKDYREKVNKIIKDYKKKARIDGFRTGHVPEGLIRKMYGKAILVDEVNKLISESLTKYIREENLKVLGEPLPSKEEQKEINFDTDKDFEFAFEVGLAPEVEIKLSKRDKVPYYDIKVDDELRQKQIEQLTKQFGSFASVEEIADKEMLKGDFVELDDEKKPKEDGIKADDVTISLEMMKDEEILKQFIGKKVGDKVVFNVRKAYPNDTEISSMLRIDKDKAEQVQGDFEYEIKNIQKFVPAEVNQELFDKAYGEGNVKSEEEFKEKVTEGIKQSLVKESDYRFGVDAKKKLVKKFDPELPEQFLKRWLMESNEGKLTEEQLDNDFPAFIEDLKWQLIKDQIAKDEEIKIAEEEVLATAKELTAMQFQQYGMGGLPDEHLENYAKEILKKDEERRKIQDKLQEDKVLENLKEKIKLDTKAVSVKEFEKIWEADKKN